METTETKSPVLPPDWIKMQSSAAQPGKDYYFNIKNKKSVWTVREALMAKNNLPPRKPMSHQPPRPPTDPEQGDSSGSEEARKTRQGYQQLAPEAVMTFPKSEEMMYPNMWGFNPHFMPYNPAMPSNFVYGQTPWHYNMMFQGNQMPGFNQFQAPAPPPPVVPVQGTAAVEDNDKIESKVYFDPDDDKMSRPVDDLRFKIEANKRRRRLSCGGESKPVSIRRTSCPNVTLDDSTDRSADATGDSLNSESQDDSVGLPLQHQSYGYWLLKEAAKDAVPDRVYICVDTNVFITRLDLVQTMINMDTENICHIVVPQCVAVELDTLSKKIPVDRSGKGPYGGMYGHARPVNLRRLASTANRFLFAEFEKNDNKFIGEPVSRDKLLQRYNTDDGLINCCITYLGNNIHTVLLTEDKNLTIRARGCNICVYSVEKMESILEKVHNELNDRNKLMKSVKVLIPNVTSTSVNKFYKPKLYEIGQTLEKNADKLQEDAPKIMPRNVQKPDTPKKVPKIPITFNIVSQNAEQPKFSNMLPSVPNFGPVRFPNMLMPQTFPPMGYPLMPGTNVPSIVPAMCNKNTQSIQNQIPTIKGQETKQTYSKSVFSNPVASSIKKYPAKLFQKQSKPDINHGKAFNAEELREKFNSIATHRDSKSMEISDKEPKAGVTKNPIPRIAFKNPEKKIRLVRNRFPKEQIQKPVPEKAEPVSMSISPIDFPQVSASMDSVSTNYPSCTTTSAVPKSMSTSLESSVQNVTNLETRQERAEDKEVDVHGAISEKILERMDEYVTQFEQVMVELLTRILLSSKRFYLIAPPWSLHEALCALSERCRADRRAVSDAAGSLAALVDRECVAESRLTVHYTRLRPRSPQSFMELFALSRKLLSALKDAYDFTEIIESEQLLEDLLKELKCGAIEEEYYQQGPNTPDENVENVLTEDFEEMPHKLNENKTIMVLDFLKNHYNEWSNVNVDEIKCGEGKGNKRPVQAEGVRKKPKVKEMLERKKLTEEIKLPDQKKQSEQNKISEQKTQPKTKETAPGSGPVIIRKFATILPEYEQKIKDIEAELDDYEYCEEEMDEEDNLEELEEEHLENDDGNLDYDENYDDEYLNDEMNGIAENKDVNDSGDLERELRQCEDKVDKITARVERVSIMDPDENDELYNENEAVQNSDDSEICVVSLAIERSISNCFAFASEQFKLKMGLEMPHPLTGDTDGLPGLPEILTYIEMFATCLRDLLSRQRCDAQLLRSALWTLAPRVPRLPRSDDDLVLKCARIAKHLTPEGLQEEVDFMSQTHSVLCKFYEEHNGTSESSADRLSRKGMGL